MKLLNKILIVEGRESCSYSCQAGATAFILSHGKSFIEIVFALKEQANLL